jgi:hypothetical protein
LAFVAKKCLKGKEDPPPPPSPSPKCKTHSQDSTLVEVEKLQDFEVMELSNKSSDSKLLHSPQGSRATKDNQTNAKFKECVLHAQVKIIVDTWQEP